MGVATSSLATPTRSKALMVRLAPYLVEAICELTRAIKDKTHAQTEISGLLFGKSQDGMVTVEALKTFKDSSGPRSDLARRERMEKAFTAAMTLANEDPEFAAFKLLGWFSLRGGGGLINSDAEFHNRHFKSPEEIAVIVWREGDTQITTEIYAAVEGGKLTTEDYRWSSVRLSSELRHVSQPLDLVMRVRMNDDLYMRTYGVSDGRERKDEWKRVADQAKRALLAFLPGRGQSEVIPEDLPLPAPTGTARRSFESRTLFKGSEAEPSSVKPLSASAPTLAPSSSTTAAPGATTRLQQPTPPPAPPVTQAKELDDFVPSFDINRAPRPKPATPEVSGLPMVLPKHKPQLRNTTPWLSTAIVFVLFSAATFGFLALKSIGGGDNKLSQIMHVLFPGSDLDLRASSHGDSLWVSWNKHNPVVASATSAVLSVSDGPRHFERKLDPSQVADGEVKYTPVSGDVTFQLRVYGADQGVAMGSLRVLDATAPVTADAQPPLDVSESTTPPPAPSAAGPANSNNLKTNITPLPANQGQHNKPFETAQNHSNIPPTAPIVQEPKQLSLPDNPKPQEGTSQPIAPVIQPAQTAQTRPSQTSEPVNSRPTPPPATPRPVTPGNNVAGSQSNTAINGWDNLPENKPAPVQRQTPTQEQTAASGNKASDFVRPKVLLQVMPNLPAGSISEVTRVEVDVTVDTNGHVKSARLNTPNVKSTVGAAVVAAAKQWTFQPATLLGQKVDSDHTIVFEFRPEGQ